VTIGLSVDESSRKLVASGVVKRLHECTRMLRKPERLHHRVWFCCRTQFYVACTFVVPLTLTGCGNMIYSYRANDATSRIEEARKAGAEKSALYEYTLAQEHLRKAQSEAAEADYGDAAELAALANDYAERALEKAKFRSTDVPPSAASSRANSTENASFSVNVGGAK
jgi:hypothetical protein